MGEYWFNYQFVCQNCKLFYINWDNLKIVTGTVCRIRIKGWKCIFQHKSLDKWLLFTMRNQSEKIAEKNTNTLYFHQKYFYNNVNLFNINLVFSAMMQQWNNAGILFTVTKTMIIKWIKRLNIERISNRHTERKSWAKYTTNTPASK